MLLTYTAFHPCMTCIGNIDQMLVKMSTEFWKNNPGSQADTASYPDTRGTSALLNEATWIIDGSNELIMDFFALVLFFFFFTASALQKSKTNIFFWIKQTNDM